MGAFKDLTGRVFGRLTVQSRSDLVGKVAWLCVCSCGGKKHLITGALTNCYVWKNGSWEVLQAGVNANNAYPTLRHGPIVSLAYEQRILHPDDILFFIQDGSGGSTLDQWLFDGSQYIVAKADFDDVIATGRTFTKHAIIWWQGESDTGDLTLSTTYETREQDFVNTANTDFGFNNFVAVNISGNTTELVYRDNVRTAKINNAAALYYDLIDWVDLNTDEAVHASSSEQVTIGERISDLIL